uniref:Uncharacterized protein n=1 Tax=Knipowitschia caucasica TaxID=637954 RepID=A0AAV2J828_KNICA
MSQGRTDWVRDRTKAPGYHCTTCWVEHVLVVRTLYIGLLSYSSYSQMTEDLSVAGALRFGTTEITEGTGSSLPALPFVCGVYLSPSVRRHMADQCVRRGYCGSLSLLYGQSVVSGEKASQCPRTVPKAPFIMNSKVWRERVWPESTWHQKTAAFLMSVANLRCQSVLMLHGHIRGHIGTGRTGNIQISSTTFLQRWACREWVS